jgi:hypothetical protein
MAQTNWEAKMEIGGWFIPACMVAMVVILGFTLTRL